MKRLALHPDQIRRLLDLSAARQLAAAGMVTEARRIFAFYGVGYIAAEVTNHSTKDVAR